MRMPDGKVVGPLLGRELKAAARNGSLTSKCHIRTGTQGEWLSPERFPELVTPSPKATHQVDRASGADAIVASWGTHDRQIAEPIFDAAVPESEWQSTPASVSAVPAEQDAEQSPSRVFRYSVAALVCANLVIAGVFIDRKLNRPSERNNAPEVVYVSDDSSDGVSSAAPPPPIDQPQQSNEAVVAKALSSIATVFVKGEAGDSTGSGFIAFDRRSLVTNFHVVEDAREIEVKFSDGERVAAKTYCIALPGSDLAVLQLEVEQTTRTPLEFADAPSIPGQHVFAIGAPLGLQNSVSDGVVSANRTRSEVNEALDSVHPDMHKDLKLVQVSAPISSGNSGGPLIDTSGRVVGVNTSSLVHDTFQNLNFAVAAHEVRAAYQNRHNPRTLATLPRSKKTVASEQRQQAAALAAQRQLEADAQAEQERIAAAADAARRTRTRVDAQLEMSRLNDRVVTAQRVLTALVLERDSLKTQYDSTIARGKQVYSEGAQAEADARGYQPSIDQVSAKLNNLRFVIVTDPEGYALLVARTENELASLQANQNIYLREASSLAALMTRLRSQADSLEAQFREKDRQIDSVRSEIERLESDFRLLQRAVQ